MENKGIQGRQKRSEPRDGTVIAGRYQVDRLLARGGMAAVYLAHHVKLNRPVALKILSPPPDAEDPGAFEERFRLEAETLASLDHQNIVILHDFGETADGRFFLAMEYVEGPRLSDVLRDGPLPVERALGLTMQVCAALRYAHKRGVIHRDLKPSNLLIRTREDGEEQIKVVDFGLVKLKENDQTITRAGLILGSPHCMAPEQVKGLEVDHRADVYAVGVLMFRILTGQYPFHGPNSAATMIAHLNQAIPTFFSVAPDLVVPAGMEEIVRKCLAKNPADRYPDMQTLMDELAVCMNIPPEQFRSVSQSHSTIQRSMSLQGGGRRGLMVGGALLVFLAMGAAAVGGGLLVASSTGRMGGTTASAEQPLENPPTEAGTTAPTEEPGTAATEDPEATTDEAGTDAAGTDEAGTDEAGTEAATIEEPVPEPPPVVKTPTPKVTTTPPTPKPPPTVVAKPPTPKPDPVVDLPPEPTKPPPGEEQPPTEETPEGYMGLPDDLFE